VAGSAHESRSIDNSKLSLSTSEIGWLVGVVML